MPYNSDLLIVVDSRSTAEYAWLHEEIMALLDHIQVPYQIHDLKEGGLSKVSDLPDYAEVLLAQENLSLRLSDIDVQTLVSLVHDGVGFVSCDPASIRRPELQALFKSKCTAAPAPPVKRLQRTSAAHTITAAQNETPKILAKPVELGGIVQVDEETTVLMLAEERVPALLARSVEAGRAVQFLVSPQLWLNQVFGHANGLDDLLWKSIVWAARKPFVMLAMPPFVTARVDDAIGAGNGFAYLNVFRDHGYIPTIGLFVDDIQDADVPILREYGNAGWAEFPPHAFRDHHLIYFDFHKAPYSDDDIRANFEYVDAKYCAWGIPLVSTVNAHYGEWGKNTLPHLIERGQTFAMCWRLPDELAKDVHRDWKPKPYGNFGCLCDVLPDYPEIYITIATPYDPQASIYLPDGQHFLLNRSQYKTDGEFLWRATTFRDESPRNNVEKAAQSGARQLKIGLDSLFFGWMQMHEQRIAPLSLEEWDAVLSLIDQHTQRYRKIFRPYSEIAVYAKNRAQVTLETGRVKDEQTVEITCKGQSDVPLLSYIFTGSDLDYVLKEIPPFKGTLTVSVSGDQDDV